MSLIQKVKCYIGVHTEGHWQSVVGGRNAKRCVHCEKILKEESVMGRVQLPKPPRPKGSETDKWFKL